MKTKVLRVMFVGWVMLALSLALPSQAQDDWPEGCQVPDLEEAISNASEAQANADMFAFVNSLTEVNRLADQALRGCVESVVEVMANFEDPDPYSINPEETLLRGINLDGADLAGVNLRDVLLMGSSLRGTNLNQADLRGAVLSHADLRGVQLIGANLQGVFWRGRLLDEEAILPDNTHWAPGTDTDRSTDTDRFTDPEHPSFWDPCVELDKPPWYCEESDD